MSETKGHGGTEGLSFEEALERLEAIVQGLEDGQLGLSESLAQYEEGIRLLKHCHSALSRVERKISLLTDVDAEGAAVSEPFDDAARTLEEKQQSRSRRRSQPPRQADSAGASAGTAPATPPPPDPASESDMDIQRGLF